MDSSFSPATSINLALKCPESGFLLFIYLDSVHHRLQMIWWQEQIFPLSECGVWVPEAVVSGFMPFSQHLADPVYLYFGRGFSSAPAATADSHYLVSVCLLDFSHFSLWCQWAWCPYTSERVLLSFPALISVFLPILGKELWVGSVFLQASWIFYIITSSYTQPLQIHHKVNYSLLCNVKAAFSPSHSSANNEQSHVSLLS